LCGANIGVLVMKRTLRRFGRFLLAFGMAIVMICEEVLHEEFYTTLSEVVFRSEMVASGAISEAIRQAAMEVVVFYGGSHDDMPLAVNLEMAGLVVAAIGLFMHLYFSEKKSS